MATQEAPPSRIWLQFNPDDPQASTWCADQIDAEDIEYVRSSGRFALGQRVRKIRGSPWQGLIVGFYSTTLTPDGYAVESEREPGSVQIYPASALEEVENG